MPEAHPTPAAEAAKSPAPPANPALLFAVQHNALHLMGQLNAAHADVQNMAEWDEVANAAGRLARLARQVEDAAWTLAAKDGAPAPASSPAPTAAEAMAAFCGMNFAETDPQQLQQTVAALAADVQTLRQALIAARIFGVPGMVLESAPSCAAARAALGSWIDAGAIGAPALSPWARGLMLRAAGRAVMGPAA